MPIKPLKIKIDLQSKPLASTQDQQLVRALFGESFKIDRVSIDVYHQMLLNVLIDMLSGDPVAYQ